MAKARVIVNRVGEGGGGFLGQIIGFHEQIIKGKLWKIDCQLTVNDGGEPCMVSLGFKLRFKSDVAKARVIINRVGEGGWRIFGAEHRVSRTDNKGKASEN